MAREYKVSISPLVGHIERLVMGQEVEWSPLKEAAWKVALVERLEALVEELAALREVVNKPFFGR